MSRLRVGHGLGPGRTQEWQGGRSRRGERMQAHGPGGRSVCGLGREKGGDSWGRARCACGKRCVDNLRTTRASRHWKITVLKWEAGRRESCDFGGALGARAFCDLRWERKIIETAACNRGIVCPLRGWPHPFSMHRFPQFDRVSLSLSAPGSVRRGAGHVHVRVTCAPAHAGRTCAARSGHERHGAATTMPFGGMILKDGCAAEGMYFGGVLPPRFPSSPLLRGPKPPRGRQWFHGMKQCGDARWRAAQPQNHANHVRQSSIQFPSGKPRPQKPQSKTP